MKVSTRFKKNSCLFFILLLFLLAPGVQAQWSSDPTENTLVTNAAKDQREPYIISDGSGGVIIAWRDYQNTSSIFGGDIYSQKLNFEGVAQWTTNGIGVNAGWMTGGQFKPMLAEDGSGGAIVNWARTPKDFYEYDLYAQKIDSDGERKWSLNDVIISNAPGTESFHQMISDGAGGAIITWMHLPETPGSTNIYTQRVDPTGIVKWTTNGVEICMAEDVQSYPVLCGDGNEGAIITWSDSRGGVGKSDIYAQLINATGDILWETDGGVICSDEHFEFFPAIIEDGEGGAIIAWEDMRSGFSDIYAQRINDSGEPQWTTNGIPICNATGNQIQISLVDDKNGGAFVIWQDDRSGSYDIYAQRVNSSGQLQWNSDGTVVSNANANQNMPKAIADGDGGIIVTWVDYRDDINGDIFAQRLNDSGETQWEENGAVICNTSGEQIYPTPTSDGNMGAIITWEDKRNGTDYDIYAQIINKNGSLGMFIDEDEDGISDQEEKGPNGDQDNYDGNNDGTPDSQQANVASFSTYDKQQYVTLVVPNSEMLEEVKAINHPDPNGDGAPDEDSYPYGFFSFKITGLSAGSSTTATFLLHNGPGIHKYYKYSPTPTQSLHWYEFSFDGETGAVISNDTIVLHLTDGERGDYDVTANGEIVEPGGPIQSASAVPLYNEQELNLEPVYPNPFSQETTIAFTIPEATDVRLEIFDLTGKMLMQLFNKKVPAGRHSMIWPSPDIPEGMYLIKMTTKFKVSTRKILKVK